MTDQHKMQPLFSLKGKTAIVAGGASGIGKAIAELFAAQGAHVVIVDLNEGSAKAVAEAIVKKGNTAESVICDISDQQGVQTSVKSIVCKLSRTDILVNSAGISHIGTLETTSENDFDRIFRVNVKGAYNMMKAVTGFMKDQGGGVILNVASVASSTGISERFAYSMSKGALLSMTLSVAKDFLKYNIRCNALSPARIHTPFVDNFLQVNYAGRESEMFEKLSKAQPIGRMGKPEEVAALALYLCSDEASFVTGCDYPIDGGFVKLIG